MKRLRVWAVVLGLLIMGCAGIQTGEKMTQFDDTARAYNRSIRWGEYEAAFSFKNLSDRENTLPDFEDYRDVRVTAYQVKQTIISEDKSKIIQLVEIQYYRLRDVTVKTLSDRQKWEYNADKQRWFLLSDLPDFK